MPKEEWYGTSLVTQWVGICLPMQGTRVQSLVLACKLQPVASIPKLRKPVCLGPVSAMRETTPVRSPSTAVKRGFHSLQLGKAYAKQ